MQHTGVLLQYKNSYKLILLDSVLGKIEVLGPVYCIGSLLHYELCYQSATLYRLGSVMLHDLPLALAQTDVLFFHHVLELCNYSIPIHAGAHIVSLLQLLYEMGSCISLQDKKLFLVKLLVLMGFFPELSLTVQQYEFQAYALAVDIHRGTPLNLEFERFLDIWLYHCMVQHPKIHEFKTIHFLTENRLK
jgi:hypothetical protein